jgi:hypothetical protein
VRKKGTARASKEGIRNTRVPKVVKTAYGPDGKLQVAAEKVKL